MKKVSIIIPIYNAVSYIDKCVGSLLSQDYNDIEIVLVNDGSTDNSLSLLQEYQIQYPNKIKVIDQKNSGQSAARNKGLKNSDGYFITFVDQDDYVKEDFISKMVEGIKDADILISGYNRIGEHEKLYQENIPKVCEWSKFKYCATWGKLYKKAFLDNNNIIFEKCKIGEDVIFLMQALSYTKKVEIISYAGYNNYRNTTSISRNINKNKNTRNKMMFMLKRIDDIIEVNNFDIDMLLYFYLKTTVLHLFVQRHILSMKELYQEYKEYFSWLKGVYKKYNRTRISFNFQDGEEKYINFYINLFLLCHKLHLTYILLWLLKLMQEQIIE